MEIVSLQRQITLLEEKHRTHSERLEHARINDELESRRICNVNVVQPATFVPKPDSPKKKLILAGGLLLAIVASFGVAAVSEYLDSTLTTADQVEANLRLPVLLTVPHQNISTATKAARGKVQQGASS